MSSRWHLPLAACTLAAVLLGSAQRAEARKSLGDCPVWKAITQPRIAGDGGRSTKAYNRMTRGQSFVSQLSPWIQPVVIIVAVIIGIIEIKTQGEMHTTILRELKRIVEKHEERLDDHDKIIGRGVPPPEVTHAIDRLERAVDRLEARE